MKGCLVILVLILLGAILSFGEHYPMGSVIIILAAIVFFLILKYRYNVEEEQSKERRKKLVEKFARDKEEFDRGYHHGFIDGLRDAQGISQRSLYDAGGSPRYCDAYKKGYRWGFNFDDSSDATDPDYPY